MKKHILLLLLLPVFFFSCKKETIVVPGNYDNGIIVINEGNYLSGNSSLSYYNLDNNTATQNIYFSENQLPLGDVAHSMTIHNGRGYIVVNNSAKVEVVSMDSLKRVGTITDILSPRYFVAFDEHKAFVSYWGNGGGIAVVDLDLLQVVGNISTSGGVEQMVIYGGRLYATVNGGLDGPGNEIAVYNASNNELEMTFPVGDYPESIVADGLGSIWVLCQGNKVYDANFNIDSLASTPGSLMQIVAGNGNDFINFGLPNSTTFPSDLTFDNVNGRLYYLDNGDIYSMMVNAANLPNAPLVEGSFYSLFYDAHNSVIYASDPADYQSEGIISRYDINGTLLGTFGAGIIPGSFVFTGQ